MATETTSTACPHSHQIVGRCRVTRVADRDVHLVDEGDGPPVVLVHGSQAWAYAWRRQIAPLRSAGYRAVAIDLPGNGWSETRPVEGGVAGQSRLIGELLDQLGEPRAALVASSAGGLPVLDFALRHPERVSALVLSSPCGVPHREPLVWRLARVPVAGEAMGLLLSRRFVSRSLREAVFDERLISDEDVSAYFEPLRRPGAWSANLEIERATDPSWVEARLHELAVPSLFVWGADDPWHPASMAGEFGRRVRGSKVEVLPRCGHLPQDELPDEFNRLMLDWLDSSAVPKVPTELEKR